MTTFNIDKHSPELVQTLTFGDVELVYGMSKSETEAFTRAVSVITEAVRAGRTISGTYSWSKSLTKVEVSIQKNIERTWSRMDFDDQRPFKGIDGHSGGDVFCAFHTGETLNGDPLKVTMAADGEVVLMDPADG